MDDKILKLKKIIDDSKKIVFFGGAGVSTESGIPDFRSVDGLYNLSYAYPPEEILTTDFFYSNTAEFYRFYKDKMLCPAAEPNFAHKYLAKLEKEGKLTAVVTQNIDGLHQKGGSERVYELHGSTLRNFCLKCGKFYGVDKILESDGIPYCDCGGLIKPDVVLYTEPLDQKTVMGAINRISEADLLIVAGTSLTVYPAASLINYFYGKNLVLINLSKTPYDRRADLQIYAKVGEVFALVDKL